MVLKEGKIMKLGQDRQTPVLNQEAAVNGSHRMGLKGNDLGWQTSLCHRR